MKTTMTTSTTEISKAIALTIYRQLGGDKFVSMTGAKNIAYGCAPWKGSEYDQSYLTFSIPKKKDTPNKVLISYDGALDLYNMVFFHLTLRTSKLTVFNTYEGLDAEQMVEAFEVTCKLYSRL